MLAKFNAFTACGANRSKWINLISAHSNGCGGDRRNYILAVLCHQGDFPSVAKSMKTAENGSFDSCILKHTYQTA